jgi:nucleotide sugar dehydrogenase
MTVSQYGPPEGDVSVSVIGLGKIGLPLAVQFARQGFTVHGVDIDAATVATVNAGDVPFPGEAHLEEYLREVRATGRLVATDDTVGAVATSAVVVVVVPLVVDADGRPAFEAMDAATAAIARGLQPGTLVAYETTLPVYTTRQRFVPALEAGSGLTHGQDFFVAFSPERVFSGRIFQDLRRYPKLVGGVTGQAGARAEAFYAAALEFDERPDLPRPNGVWNLGSSEAAELAKLAETTYRDLSIAFANELAVFAESAGVDVFQVIAASNSQPFSHIHQPGVAVGGHCIPVYPRLLLSTALDATLPRAARAANDAMPARAVDRLVASYGPIEGARVAILGAAFRGGVKETAFSGVFPLVREVERRGGVALVHDPLYSDAELEKLGLRPYHIGETADAAIVHTDHELYRTLEPSALPGIRVLYDGRRVTESAVWTAAGVAHLQLGQVTADPAAR